MKTAKNASLIFMVTMMLWAVAATLPAQPQQPAGTAQEQSDGQAQPQLPSGVAPPDTSAGRSPAVPKPMEEAEPDEGEETSLKERFEQRDPLLEVVTSVDTAKITIGEKITYRIEVIAESNISVEFPQFGEFLGGLAITDYRQLEPEKNGDMVTYVREYVLDMYVSGSYMIPPARVTYKLGKDGDEQELFSVPLFVTVDSVLTGDDVQLRGIKPVATPQIEINKKLMLLIIIGCILLIAAIVAGIIIWRRKKQYIAPGLPPHVIALQALDEIRRKNLIEQGKIKEYYYQVSNVLRHYIEGRFAIMAPERTTEEFLGELQKTSVLNSDQKSVLKSFLTHCDMVKFARFSPTQEQIEQVFATALDFIDQTKPYEEPSEEEYYDEDEEDE